LEKVALLVNMTDVSAAEDTPATPCIDTTKGTDSLRRGLSGNFSCTAQLRS